MFSKSSVLIFASAAFAAISGSAAAAVEQAQVTVMTNAQMDAWLATTDAKLTYITDGTARSPLNTRVVYCNRRTQNVCGGSCTVYNGNAKCLGAPGTQCLSATTNVGFCDRGGCQGSCNQYSSCGTRLDNRFCFTPGTASILVPAT
ncbi:hypothetical protein BDV98DRAFT_561783 [Pterulicium gracile]|uniref:Uncharacterized protein n=1 Tax=Pterulicium gracile TaxID=1884261 RepID=A0A5C3QTD3_9AGAR|nr:hypothetical protein BDV98DRAFT_561783 [Pterula gracilis]